MLLLFTIRFLQRNKIHSYKAIRGLGFTVAIVISLLSIISGLSTEISSLVLQTGNSQSIIIKSKMDNKIPSNLLENLSLSNVKAILPIEEFFVQIKINDQFYTVNYFKVNFSAYLQTHEATYIQEGRFPEIKSEILVDSTLAKTMNLDINSKIILNESILTIVGIFQDNYGLINSIIFEQDDSSHVDFIEVVLENPAHGKQTIELLEAFTSDDIKIFFKQRNVELLDDVINEILSKFLLIILIIALISCIRIYFFMMWIIIQHHNDFLILRIVGYSKNQVLLLVLTFGLIVGNLGLFFGFMLGILLPIIFSSLATSIFATSYIAFIPTIELVISSIFILNGFLLIGIIKPIWEINKAPLVVQQLGSG